MQKCREGLGLLCCSESFLKGSLQETRGILRLQDAHQENFVWGADRGDGFFLFHFIMNSRDDSED